MRRAAAHLLRHREGVLSADGAISKVRFIIDGTSGDLVFPTPGALTDVGELVLHVPHEQPDDDPELSLLLSVTGPATPDAQDRWSGYHGTPDRPGFVSCRIDAAKFDGDVVEENLALVNTIRSGEGALRRRINSDKTRLRAACARVVSVQVPEPVAVGVDQFGIDVRASFGIIRLEFPQPAANDADAQRCLDELLGVTG